MSFFFLFSFPEGRLVVKGSLTWDTPQLWQLENAGRGIRVVRCTYLSLPEKK